MQAITKFFGSILSAFDSFTGHYLLAIFLFAVLMKLILLPFGIKQQKNSVKQAKLRPREMAIRSKYKGRTDQPTQQKMQSEIMELYQKEGYNPAGGCLPMLIQLPVLIILYNVIISPLKYICGYTAEMINGIANYLVNTAGITGITLKDGAFAGRDIDLIKYITEEHLQGINEALGEIGTVILEDLPNFSFFGNPTALAQNPTWTSWLVLIPILNFGFTLLSQFITRKLTFQPMQDQQNQPSMKIMTIMMSGMTLYIAFVVPAAIGIYWLFNSILGMLQQFILAKTIPLPKFTEEDFAAAEREYKGTSQTKKANNEKIKAALSRPMDEDEYADLGEYSSVYDEEPAVKEEKPTGDSVMEKAPLKKKNK